PTARDLLLLRRLPVSNIIFASSPAIRAQGHQIVRGGVVLAGTLVNVGVLPRIVWYFASHVGPFPTRGIAWLLDKILEAVLSFRIVTIIHLERVERSAEGGDLRLCGG